MKTHFFKVVQTVAQHGSFSEAAAILGCSQSNISYAIKEVEDFSKNACSFAAARVARSPLKARSSTRPWEISWPRSNN